MLTMRSQRDGTQCDERRGRKVLRNYMWELSPMEELEASIINTCPLAFSGVTGSLFVQAITALIAAHCEIIDDYSWPKDDFQQILNNENSFDFIVVGAGTAGSVLASRLTNINPSWTVLLVESGDDPEVDSEIPAFLIFNQNTSMDWNYKTISSENCCLGLVNNSCIWSKGKAMGGSSSINAMLYLRGHPNDYNEWAKLGNPEWTYNHLEKYFKIIENKLKLHEYKYPENPWYNIITQAWAELGYSSHKENDDDAKIGTRITKLLVVKGKRLNTGKVYLNESTNLRVMKQAQVQKVIINPVTRIATGVKIRHASGNIITINANKEVILSAGTIGTPQILMLSGIGPKNHLVDKNIKGLMNLPVGQNLQDHILLPILLTTNLNTILKSETISLFFLQYMLNRSGPFSNLGITDFMGFIDTNYSSDYPNIQFHHTYFPKKDELMLKTYFERVGYKEEIVKNIVKLNEESDLLGIYPTLLHPKSRGSILLADADPITPPIINANYLDHPDDIEGLINAVNFIRELTKTQSLQKYGIKIAAIRIPKCLDYSEETRQFWVCYIRHMTTTIYHPVGTAKMGPITDKTSVVNQDLRVHGVKHLRVVDASIMPSITGGNTMAPTLAIAEKAADKIEEYYEFKDEL